MAIKPSLNNINNFVAPSNPANKTTTYAAGSHDVYHRKKEYVVYCTKCNAVIRTDWEEESKTQNYKGGEVLRESDSLESVKYN